MESPNGQVTGDFQTLEMEIDYDDYDDCEVWYEATYIREKDAYMAEYAFEEGYGEFADEGAEIMTRTSALSIVPPSFSISFGSAKENAESQSRRSPIPVVENEYGYIFLDVNVTVGVYVYDEVVVVEYYDGYDYRTVELKTGLTYQTTAIK